MYIGDATYTNDGTNIFTEYVDQTITLPVSTDAVNMTTSISV
jgi:hypothetical protein